MCVCVVTIMIEKMILCSPSNIDSEFLVWSLNSEVI